MKKAALPFVILLSIFSGISYAQHIGYVITKKNDTINCYSVKSVTFGGIRYQVTENSDLKKVLADNIKEYQITEDSSIYVNKILSDHTQPRFVQREEFGRICLYSIFVNASGRTYLTWYISKDNDTAFALKTSDASIISSVSRKKVRKDKLTNMFSDQPALAALFKEDSFDFDTIRSYIQRYNKAATASAK